MYRTLLPPCHTRLIYIAPPTVSYTQTWIQFLKVSGAQSNLANLTMPDKAMTVESSEKLLVGHEQLMKQRIKALIKEGS